jgi:hypothetical protein
MTDFNTMLETSVRDRAEKLGYNEIAVFLFFKRNNVIMPHDEEKAQNIVDKVMEGINNKMDDFRQKVLDQPLEVLQTAVCRIVGHSVHSNMDNWLDFLADGKVW